MSPVDKTIADATIVRRQHSAAIVRRSLDAVKNPRVPFRMPALRPLRFPKRIIDIRDFGAVADGQTPCTVAIARAIQACVEAGGGRVLIPAGSWFTGAIHLRDNIDLHLAEGATVRFSSQPADYLPAVFVRWDGQECHNYSPFIYASACRNVAITGAGSLMGQGAQWDVTKKSQNLALARLHQMVADDVPVEQRRFAVEEFPLRPQMICFINCAGVLLEDFSITEGGPARTIHVAYCQDVLIRRLRVAASARPGNDGISIDSTCNAIVEDCQLQTADDCVALKSGLNGDGCRVGKATENVVVRRIRATGGLGGIAIGGEIAGGIRNVFVHDCNYAGLAAGISIKAKPGRGGTVENVFVDNVTMGNIPGDAIQMMAEGSSSAKADRKPMTFRNIQMRNITCEQADTAVRMVGLADAPLREVVLENVNITAREGLYCTASNGVRLINVRITPRSGPVLSVKDSQHIVIDGLNSVHGRSVFLDLRGRQIRDVRLKGDQRTRVRPVVVLGVDVPKDAIIHE
ncbi:MAG TPA: glycoside hydrolase family 28 protein [Tepidisphaeraceae bacterium]|nr:glycoside hydrolase family 28 protein [Tepidisphaeraceae bacterium]